MGRCSPHDSFPAFPDVAGPVRSPPRCTVAVCMPRLPTPWYVCLPFLAVSRHPFHLWISQSGSVPGAWWLLDKSLPKGWIFFYLALTLKNILLFLWALIFLFYLFLNYPYNRTTVGQQSSNKCLSIWIPYNTVFPNAPQAKGFLWSGRFRKPIYCGLILDINTIHIIIFGIQRNLEIKNPL